MAGTTQYGIFIADDIIFSEQIPLAHQSHLLKDAEASFANLPSFTFLSQSYSDEYYQFHSYRIVANESVSIPFYCKAKATILLYILEGECQINEESHIKPDCFLIKEVAKGRHFIDINYGIHSLLIVHLKEEIACLIEERAINAIFHLPSESMVTTQMNKLATCMTNMLSGYVWKLHREVIILDMAFQSLELSGVKFKSDKTSNRNPAYETMISIRDYILHNLDRRISISALSKQFRIVSTKIRSDFFEVFEQDLREFIRSSRMNKARELLLVTNKSVEEVAWEMGFETTLGFSRSFTLHFQQSPSHFRQSIKYENGENNS